jgi:hypothetical protein
VGYIEGGVNLELTYHIPEDCNGRHKSSTHKFPKVRVARGAKKRKEELEALSHELVKLRDLANLPVEKGRPRGKIPVGVDFLIGK